MAAALILPLYFLADATITLARRALRGEKVWRAHREHFYQRAVLAGLGHAAMVRRVIAANLALMPAPGRPKTGTGSPGSGRLASSSRSCSSYSRGRAENQPMTNPIKRALLSVSDKEGLVPFARELAARGVALISTGGTAKALADAGLPVTEVAQVTGFPEMLDGRVKTLHPAVHGGLLARRDRDDHLAALARHGIAEIDLLVVNLYPFAATVASGAGREDCIENIDIGGPALIRGAAKNHEFVAVVTDPADYQKLLGEMAREGGGVSLAMKRELARKAYATTGAYDAAIASWMAREEEIEYPDTLIVAARLADRTRYGENPHQGGAFYRTGESRPSVAVARQMQGLELSYNNYNDADAAFEAVAEFAEPAVVIVKHATRAVSRSAVIFPRRGRAP